MVYAEFPFVNSCGPGCASPPGFAPAVFEEDGRLCRTQRTGPGCDLIPGLIDLNSCRFFLH